jgi:hypothetical protein
MCREPYRLRGCAAGRPPVAEDVRERYVGRDVGGLTIVRFSELFMSEHNLGYQAFIRTDGNVLQPAAFGLLRTPLSST